MEDIAIKKVDISTTATSKPGLERIKAIPNFFFGIFSFVFAFLILSGASQDGSASSSAFIAVSIILAMAGSYFLIRSIVSERRAYKIISAISMACIVFFAVNMSIQSAGESRALASQQESYNFSNVTEQYGKCAAGFKASKKDLEGAVDDMFSCFNEIFEHKGIMTYDNPKVSE